VQLLLLLVQLLQLLQLLLKQVFLGCGEVVEQKNLENQEKPHTIIVAVVTTVNKQTRN
jgi:hypothetical protein